MRMCKAGTMVVKKESLALRTTSSILARRLPGQGWSIRRRLSALPEDGERVQAIASVMLDSFTKRGEVAQALELVDEFVDLPLPSADLEPARQDDCGGRWRPATQDDRELCRRKNAGEALELVKEMRAAG
ncbi:hypothetical protein SELMODRAFT_419901 [Selaginella moellendorffii]|uniref:Uncharacterized protein n=1 Tax=Selaginella moellendorffii TaxID=88036 RepID=D8SAW7_SELML|nr:hypothetical protein SELMODRAFT_419901 [Selaginella moellendorffii]